MQATRETKQNKGGERGNQSERECTRGSRGKREKIQTKERKIKWREDVGKIEQNQSVWDRRWKQKRQRSPGLRPHGRQPDQRTDSSRQTDHAVIKVRQADGGHGRQNIAHVRHQLGPGNLLLSVHMTRMMVSDGMFNGIACESAHQDGWTGGKFIPYQVLALGCTLALLMQQSLPLAKLGESVESGDDVEGDAHEPRPGCVLLNPGNVGDLPDTDRVELKRRKENKRAS